MESDKNAARVIHGENERLHLGDAADQYQPGEMTATAAEPRDQRDQRDARQAIAHLVDARRREFQLDVAAMVQRIATFGHAAGAALGEISRDEAVDALEREALNLLARLRVGRR